MFSSADAILTDKNQGSHPTCWRTAALGSGHSDPDAGVSDFGAPGCHYEGVYHVDHTGGEY